ncbi:hypothetical protein CO724_17205 [Ectopseudomonas mendocina]|nr:hypothetical protein CO724_17205 [Pseudomonas mendocina]
MAIPFLTCLFFNDWSGGTKLYVTELGIDGEVSRQGLISRLPSQDKPIMRDADGLYYYTEEDGGVVRMYSTALVGEEEEPSLELVRQVDLALPSHLPSFIARLAAPLAVMHQGQAAMVGCGGYTYSSGGWVDVGVAFAASSAGEIVNSAVIETDTTPFALTFWNGAVAFADGTFAAYDWVVPT